MEFITISEKMNMTVDIRELRRKTGMSARKFAKVIGSNTCSVYNWEQGKTSPRNKKIYSRINALIAFIERLEKNPDLLL